MHELTALMIKSKCWIIKLESRPNQTFSKCNQNQVLISDLFLFNNETMKHFNNLKTSFYQLRATILIKKYFAQVPQKPIFSSYNTLSKYRGMKHTKEKRKKEKSFSITPTEIINQIKENSKSIKTKIQI